MIIAFQLAGRRLLLLTDKREIRSRQLGEMDLGRFKEWAARYETAVHADRAAKSVSLEPLLGIGREITAWLNSEGWIADLGDDGPLFFDIAVSSGGTPEARALLDVPWEVMATERGFFAGDAARPFCIQRRIAEVAPGAVPAAPLTPRYQSLKLMFMAASPRAAEPVLDYEAEEAAILHATRALPLTLVVEEKLSAIALS